MIQQSGLVLVFRGILADKLRSPPCSVARPSPIVVNLPLLGLCYLLGLVLFE
jgi:hypothetical protein